MTKDKLLEDWEREQVAPRTSQRVTEKEERTGAGTCPVCRERLARVGDPPSRTRRRRRQCPSCNAVAAPELRCSSCGTHRVWRGKKGRFCQGCGAEHEG